MTPDIHRGGPFPASSEYLEAKMLGGYPTWKCWRHQVEERFGEEIFANGDFPVESIVRDFYILRRQQQRAGKINQDTVEAFWLEASKKIPTFEEGFGSVIKFIIDKTPIAPLLSSKERRT